MKSMLASFILAASLVGLAPLAAQDQNSEVVPVGPDKFLRWFGHAGRTYFVQISDPNEPLRRWVWAPIIETGTGLEISYEVDGTADEGFFRLWFTDEPTADPDGADFDGDGLDNLAEVSLHQTNPLKADTDGDGLPDAWELAHALDPNDDGATNAHHGASGDPDHDGLTNSAELALAIHPNSADSDGDGSGDRVEADAGADPASPLSVPLRWISTGRGGATMATPPFIYASWSSTFQTGDYSVLSNLVQALSTVDFPNFIPTSSLVGFGVRQLGSGLVGEHAHYYTSPAGYGEMHQKCYWLEVRPATPVEIRRSALKVTRTYHDGVEKDPIIEQVEFTIPAGGTLSNRIDLLPALPTFPPNVSQIRAEQSIIQVEVSPDSDQPGHTGDLIPSNKGAYGEKHYVSPKKTPEIPDDFVVLQAAGIAQDLFLSLLEWEGGEAHPTDPMKRKVSRNTAAKTVVTIKLKQSGAEVAKMNVWVVWSEVTATVAEDYQFLPSGDPWDRWSYASSPLYGKRWRFLFTIQPSEIITAVDRPNLDGANNTKPPGHGSVHHHLTQYPADHATHKWDTSRQLEVTVVNPNLIPKTNFPALLEYVNQPKALDVPISFPKDPVQGNDDPGGVGFLDEDSNPYAAFQAPPRVDLIHQIGQISCSDRPEFNFLNSMGIQGSTLAVVANFKEFARLNLIPKGKSKTDGDGWYRISTHTLWHHVMAATYGEFPTGSGTFRWVDSGSVSATGRFDIPEEP